MDRKLVRAILNGKIAHKNVLISTEENEKCAQKLKKLFRSTHSNQRNKQVHLALNSMQLLPLF
jgi:hypothetical protein